MSEPKTRQADSTRSEDRSSLLLAVEEIATVLDRSEAQTSDGGSSGRSDGGSEMSDGNFIR